MQKPNRKSLEKNRYIINLFYKITCNLIINDEVKY